jgi:hypothetical protein
MAPKCSGTTGWQESADPPAGFGCSAPHTRSLSPGRAHFHTHTSTARPDDSGGPPTQDMHDHSELTSMTHPSSLSLPTTSKKPQRKKDKKVGTTTVSYRGKHVKLVTAKVGARVPAIILPCFREVGGFRGQRHCVVAPAHSRACTLIALASH